MTEPPSKDSVFIAKLTEIIQENISNENFGVSELSAILEISRYGLNRRLRKINKKNANQFIREIRLQRALSILQNESVTVSEVAYNVGFSSPAYFNTCFRDFFGYSPGKIKKEGVKETDLNNPATVNAEHEQMRAGSFAKRWIVLIPVLVVIIAIIIYGKIFRRDALEDLRSSDGKISVVIMPFRNMTNDSTWNIWQDGIQTSFITSLSNAEELSVKASITDYIQSKGLTDYAALTPSVASNIAKKLDAKVFISGSIIQSGTAIRINAHIFNTKREKVLKSFEIEGPSEEEMLFKIIDTLKNQVMNFLIISKLKKEDQNSKYFIFDPVNSPEEYKYMVSASKAIGRIDYNSAIDLAMQVLKIDSNIYDAYSIITTSYWNQGNYEQGKRWCLRYYSKLDRLNLYNKLWVNWLYAQYFKTPNEEIKYIKQMIDLRDQSPGNHASLAYDYYKLFQYDKAIPEYEKALEIHKKWDTKPWRWAYTELGFAYHKTGQLRKEKRLYKKAEKDYPESPQLIAKQASLFITEGDTVSANKYLKRYILVCKNDSWSEAAIANGIAGIYSEGDNADKAEEFYRNALSIEPENPLWMNNLSYYMIDKDRNINEGLVLINEALKIKPRDYLFIHTKGWGLYKQGKNKEALELLEIADSLKPVYSHRIYLHLQEVRRAVTNRKSDL